MAKGAPFGAPRAPGRPPEPPAGGLLRAQLAALFDAIDKNPDGSVSRSELLRRGVHLGIIDFDQRTALHLAIENGHADCAVALVELGYVEETARGRTCTSARPSP